MESVVITFRHSYYYIRGMSPAAGTGARLLMMVGGDMPGGGRRRRRMCVQGAKWQESALSDYVTLLRMLR